MCEWGRKCGMICHVFVPYYIFIISNQNLKLDHEIGTG
ncbi:hypothetical protein PPHE_a2801 [Pseudoalteromonas phenolica O-BC30]|nr:hypothetical protein [Pseudoalteromonas phenolica O-BC30]